MVKLNELELEYDRWRELFVLAFSVAGKRLMLIELERVKLCCCIIFSDFFRGLLCVWKRAEPII
jgi:hypothetical protein